MDSNVKSLTKVQLQKKVVELSGITGAQEITIEKLNKKIDELLEQISHLESMLVKKNNLIGNKSSTEMDEVLIAKVQLQKLGEKALNRDLTNEEARRFEIFSKVIQNAERLDSARVNIPRIKDVTPKELIDMAQKRLPQDSNE